MLAIRMRRTGRKGHAQFRVIVQDSRFSPTSGRVVAYLGSYDPHAKATVLDKDKVSAYLSNGAQPSERVAKLLKAQGIKLPEWVKESSPKKRAIRHPEKLRRNRPPEAAAPEAPAAEEVAVQENTEETPAEAGPAEAAETASEPEAEPTEETPAAEENTEANQPAEASSEEPSQQ